MATVTFITGIEDVSADLSSANLVDLTTYTSPARNTIGIYVYLFKRDANNNDTAIVVSNSNPTTATFWSFALPEQDGTFTAVLFGFPIWSAGVYTSHQCVIYNGSYYYVNVSSTSQTPGGADWVIITDILGTVPGLSADNVSQTQTYNFSDAHASAGPIGDACADLGPSIKDGKCKNWQQAAAVVIGGALDDSAWFNFRRGDYVKSQQIMDYLDAQTASTL